MSRVERERSAWTARTSPRARMLATSASRSAGVIVSGSWLRIMRAPAWWRVVRLGRRSLCGGGATCPRREHAGLIQTPLRTHRKHGSQHRARPCEREVPLTRAPGDVRRGETLGQNRVRGARRGRGRLWPCSRAETRLVSAPFANPRGTWAKTRKRRRGLSAAFPENQRAGRFRNRPGNRAGATLFATAREGKRDTRGGWRFRKLQVVLSL